MGQKIGQFGTPIESVALEQAYDPLDDMLKVKSLQKKWRSDFTGSALNPDKWEVIQTGSGHTITVSGGVLSINTGVTPSTETILQSKETFTDPVRAIFGLMLSQRIANQEFYVELVSVDPVTGQADGLHAAAWRMKYEDYTSATTYAVYEVQNNAQPRLASSAGGIGNSLTAWGLLEIELFSDEVWFHSRAMDSSNGRSASFVRHQQIPDPNGVYKIRIRAKNLGTAPASATDFKLQFVNVVDYAELTAEITAGRGNVASGQSMGVQVLNTPTGIARVDSNITPWLDSTSAQAVNATVTGTTRDAGSSYSAYSRFRVTVMHLAGLAHGHLAIEQCTDNATWRETHRIPIPSDGNYRTLEFPWNLRYIRVKFYVGSVAQTGFFLATAGVRSDGGFDFDKTYAFTHSVTALAASATFTGVTLNLGSNHSFDKHRCMVYATGGGGTLYFDESRDGTNWRTTDSRAVTDGVPVEFDSLIVSQYQRIRYVNGAAAQTAFELQTALIRS